MAQLHVIGRDIEEDKPLNLSFDEGKWTHLSDFEKSITPERAKLALLILGNYSIKEVKIRLLPQHDQRQKYPLTFDEQRRLFNHLPDHLRQMSLFMVNTGTRDSEVCNLQWSMEIPIEPLNNSVFLIPSQLVKNGYDRVIVLNSVAKQVIDEQRGKHPSHVFSFRGKPLNRMNNTGWKVARAAAGLKVRVHDLKHTYGTRLRSAGVDEETRKELLGHRSGRSITTHYCDANIKNLIEASERATNPAHESTLLTILIRKSTR
ncbi:tyrosine-type recombinase/integrase [Thioflexithrix psekupsensis]|uniref:tyrosine-type recombinase/integrase n=1 Tax=Thioflexithrix psekupsensis TaxID=1570016 RepID=UPI001C3CA46C|nr:tyrosine-type recombinase/integrase [Thioflexithrix psekupsensis]